MRAEEIMAAARLGDWGVRTIRTVGIDLVDGVEVQIPADDKRMTVRRNPVTGATEYLGVVGTDYTVVQNEAPPEHPRRQAPARRGQNRRSWQIEPISQSRMDRHDGCRRPVDKRW
ncbi:hypothetical protein QQG74_12800 [Micromonospora sp. FIMYZ51]|uniref:hypothetical protein n=1 Tax=Micromonospora sp. FIMYZ51 TaxID=3051832 RepID=UPI00311F794F